MTIKSDEAAAMIKEVENVVARVKQSRVYRVAAVIIILWGLIDLVRDLLLAFAPREFAPYWWVVDLAGVAGTIVLLRMSASPAGRFPLRIVSAFALFYAFGFIWCDVIGRFGPRERMAFWPTLFLFGFAVAGLWFGAVFTLMGLGLSALVVAGYLWSGDAFALWQAIVTGLGFILCGVLMRRAS